MDPVIVVCGLIFNESGKVLMTKRLPNKLRPGMWEMPGGKLDEGDRVRTAAGNIVSTAEQGPAAARLMRRPQADPLHAMALRRELREELGVRVSVGPLVAEAHFDWDGPADLFLYHSIILGDDDPKPLEADDLQWFNMRDALANLPMCPAQYTFYPKVMSYIAEMQKILADVRVLFP